MEWIYIILYSDVDRNIAHFTGDSTLACFSLVYSEFNSFPFDKRLFLSLSENVSFEFSSSSPELSSVLLSE